MLPKLPREKLLDLYKTMLVMRRFEEALIKVTKTGISVGHFHVYIGEECTGAPALSLLRPHDAIFTTHRNHGHLLARGADPGRLMAEILGKATGYNKGKGGTLHTTVRELGFLTSSGIVGGVIPLATGAAFAAKQRKTGGASMCLFGDGALEEGVFHESLNMAALWSLPVIYLCENNSLGALGQKAGEFSSSTIAARSLLDLATPYGIPAVSVDGADAGAVYQAVQKALARARKGQGATFIEAKTFRWPGSRPVWPELLTGETDLRLAWDLKAIPKQHSDWHRKKDGLLRFTRELVKSGRATAEQILELDREACDRIERAVRFARESPEPKPEAALEGVFA
ncbi:MAG: thiamine pyrophosphate-dependent dehydrogenase E1 component subunit alpha [Deltaproteobacteria bacterium]|nr:thiamine pyrophosphate-dependent dehydrogenase E1 component subunit alpha [Deltaproteobacteria bacterium]